MATDRTFDGTSRGMLLARLPRVLEDIRGAVKGIPLNFVVIGLAVRAALAPYTSWSNDVAVWFHASQSGYFGLHLYDKPGFSYPPVWGYMLQALGYLIRLVGLGPSFFGTTNSDFSIAHYTTNDFSTIVTSPGFNLLFKSVLFGFDLTTAALVYRVVADLTGDLRKARLAFALWFLNPLVIYESSVEGAADTIVAFLILTTIVLALDRREFWAGVAWAVGIFTKLSPAFLGLELLAILVINSSLQPQMSPRQAISRVASFVEGSIGASVVILLPEIVDGSLSSMVLNVFHRTQEGLAIGGLSVTGIRHLRPFAWLLPWGYQNSAVVVRASEIAISIACVGWAAWAGIVIRRGRVVFGALAGGVGTLASAMLLSPIAQPAYALWWLPLLVIIVVVAERWYWQLSFLSATPLVFTLGILGPAAILAPLATYTSWVSAGWVATAVSNWYVAPGQFTGPTVPDDFFGPAAIVTMAALGSMFASWFNMSRLGTEPRLDIPDPGGIIG